jgi:excisionase family DNA binding protein
MTEMLTAEKAAEIIDRKYRTVLGYIHSGKLRAELRGRHWYIHPDDLEEFAVNLNLQIKNRSAEHSARVMSAGSRKEANREAPYATIEEAIEAALSGKVKPFYVPAGITSLSVARRLAEEAAGDGGQPPLPERNVRRWPRGDRP